MASAHPALALAAAHLECASRATGTLLEDSGPLVHAVGVRALHRIAQTRAVADGRGRAGGLTPTIATAVGFHLEADPGACVPHLHLAPRDEAPAQPLTEAARIAVASLVSVALSNAWRHRPSTPIAISTHAADDERTLLLVESGSLEPAPLADQAPDWPALEDSPLRASAGRGLGSVARAVAGAGGELRVQHIPARTVLAAWFPHGDPADEAPRATGCAGATLMLLEEHGAAGLLAELRPLVSARIRGALDRALEELAAAAECAAAALTQPVQPLR